MLKRVLDEKVVTVGDLALCQAHRLSEPFDVEEHDKTGRLGCPVDHADVVLVSCNTLLTMFTSYVCMSVCLLVCLSVCIYPPLTLRRSKFQYLPLSVPPCGLRL